MRKNLEENDEQKELQQVSWDLVEKLIDGIPPLKEWTGNNSGYRVQFSMMTDSANHAVKPHHKDYADIAPQFFLCLGDCTGSELLTWDQGRHRDPHPQLSTDVRNRLIFFDRRLKHTAATWMGKYISARKR